MRPASMALLSALAARTPMWSGDLFTFALRDGSTFYFTSADQPIAANGHVFSAVGPAIERSAWSVKNTTEVPQLDIKIFTTGADFAPGNLKLLIHDGYLDGAIIRLDRVFMPRFGDTSLGTVLLFEGRTGRVEINATVATVTVKAGTVILEQYMPRNTYQLGCIHTLYDTGCTLDRASHTSSFTVAASSARNLGWSSPVLPNPALFLGGTLTITSGRGFDQRRTISDCAPTGVLMSYGLLTVPEAGDTFTMEQGCNKTMARCQSFANLVHYRGFPYIPPAVLAV